MKEPTSTVRQEVERIVEEWWKGPVRWSAKKQQEWLGHQINSSLHALQEGKAS